MNNIRLWNFIEYPLKWLECDTSILDDISPSWLERRKVLTDNSSEYITFIDRLKRRHAIETGVVERLYDIDREVTETLISEGFISTLISHNDTNIEKETLMNHLQDHLSAINFVFDIVKENRQISKSFICELHHMTTLHQANAEGRDQFGNKTKIPLLKGQFKQRENNPTRADGTVILYCPPEHVEAEMDKLIEILRALTDNKIHPLIIASWLHHAFTTIHPFQDGNGRVVRLLSSLILIKLGLFPITVLREESKVKYIYALEAADNGEPQPLVNYFAELQRRNIEEALNLRDVSENSLDEVTKILKEKLLAKKAENLIALKRKLSDRREMVFSTCSEYLNFSKDKILRDFGSAINIYIGSCRPDDVTKQHYFNQQIINFANKNNYYVNKSLPKFYFNFGIDLKDGKKYELIFTVHHYGYDNKTIAIGGFLLNNNDAEVKNEPDLKIEIDLQIKPFIISVFGEKDPNEKNIKEHLENILTIAFGIIASEI